MAIGRTGSYGFDKPLEENYIGQALSETEKNGFLYRQEQRLAEEKKKREEEAKLQDISNWDGKFDPNVVGYTSIDSPLVSMALQAKQRAGEITKQLYDPRLTTEQKVALMSERNKIAQSFDIANQTPQLIKDKVKSLEDGIKNGKYNPRDVDFMQNIAKQLESGKYELNYDERGTPKVKIYQTDENGKPTGVLQETTLNDLTKAFEPKLAFNYENYKDTTLKNVKPDEFGYQTGANVVKGTRLSEGNKQQAKTFADVIISDPNKLYEAQYLFKEKDPEKLRAKLENDFITSIPTGKVQSLDTGYLNYLKSNKPEEKEKPTIVSTNNLDLREDIYKDKNGKKIIFDRRGIKPQAVTFKTGLPIENIGGEGGLNTLNVKSVLIDKNNNIIFTGTVLDTKGSSSKTGAGPSAGTERTGNTYKRVTRQATGETEGVLASKMGFENAEQLKSYLNSIQPKEVKKQESNKDPLGLF